MRFSALNARNYLQSIGDRSTFGPDVILTPHKWLAQALVSEQIPFEKWEANDALVSKGVNIKERVFDLVLCLPGASMALVTLEEVAAAGAQRCVFLGTAAAIEERYKSGDVLFDGNVVSVSNPFEEQKNWGRIAGHEAVDMETEFLRELCKKRGLSFRSAMIITDRIGKDFWESLERNEAYQKTLFDSMEKVKEWLSGQS